MLSEDHGAAHQIPFHNVSHIPSAHRRTPLWCRVDYEALFAPYGSSVYEILLKVRVVTLGTRSDVQGRPSDIAIEHLTTSDGYSATPTLAMNLYDRRGDAPHTSVCHPRRANDCPLESMSSAGLASVPHSSLRSQRIRRSAKFSNLGRFLSAPSITHIREQKLICYNCRPDSGTDNPPLRPSGLIFVGHSTDWRVL